MRFLKVWLGCLAVTAAVGTVLGIVVAPIVLVYPYLGEGWGEVVGIVYVLVCVSGIFTVALHVERGEL